MIESDVLLANHCRDAASMQLTYQDLPAQQTVAGAPRVGSAVLGQLGACTIGVWEISPSVSTDIEADEFFIVLSGAATVSFTDGAAPLHLRAGSVGHFQAGAATTWSVSQTLRKVYIV